MSEIYFIRHGQASFGTNDYDRLSPIGIRQADIVANHLVALDLDFQAVYCGRMKRQQDTAHPFCRNLASRFPTCVQPLTEPAFDEYDAKALLLAHGQSSWAEDAGSPVDLGTLTLDNRTFQAYFTRTIYRWIDGYFDGRPGVELWAAFQDRVRTGMERLMKRHGSGSRIAVFTSGGPISLAVQMALDLSDRKTAEISWLIMNASLTSIQYNTAGPTLAGFNNTTPLLLAKDPLLLTYR